MSNLHRGVLLAGLLSLHGVTVTAAAAQNPAPTLQTTAPAPGVTPNVLKQRTILARQSAERAMKREEANLDRLRQLENPKGRKPE